MPNLTDEQLGLKPVLSLASRGWRLFAVDHPDNRT